MQTPVCAASFLPGANISEVHDLPEGHAWRAILRRGVSQPFGFGVAIDQTPLVDAQQHLQYDQARRTEYAAPPTLACLAVAAPHWTGLCARPSPSPATSPSTQLQTPGNPGIPGNASGIPTQALAVLLITGRHGPRVQTTAACPRALSHSAVKVLAAQASNGTPSAYSARCDPDWGLGNGTLVWCWLHCDLFGGGPLDGSRLAGLSIARPPGSSWLRSRGSKPLGCRGSGRNGFWRGYFESSTTGLAGDHVRGGRGGRGLGRGLSKGPVVLPQPDCMFGMGLSVAKGIGAASYWTGGTSGRRGSTCC